jgi:tetratricopeptide (TPR) repeat protein
MKIHDILLGMLVLLLLAAPALAADSTESLNTAGALYSKSVDLANEGKYEEALIAADKALAINASSMNGLIQSNRAGILVMLHRYDEAITAADAAIAVEGNLTAVHSIAWYNKGNALRAQGNIPDAKNAYDHAFALDNTLVPPDMSHDVTVSATQISVISPARKTPVISTSAIAVLAMNSNPPTPAQKSPLSPLIVAGALSALSCMAVFRRK